MNIVCFNEYDFSIVELNVMADEANGAKSEEEEEEKEKIDQKLFSTFCLS